MQTVTINFKDGTKREFRSQPRPGGSYSLRVKYEGAFVIVIDEWHNEKAYPAADVREIETQAEPGRW